MFFCGKSVYKMGILQSIILMDYCYDFSINCLYLVKFFFVDRITLAIESEVVSTEIFKISHKSNINFSSALFLFTNSTRSDVFEVVPYFSAKFFIEIRSNFLKFWVDEFAAEFLKAVTYLADANKIEMRIVEQSFLTIPVCSRFGLLKFKSRLKGF